MWHVFSKNVQSLNLFFVLYIFIGDILWYSSQHQSLTKLVKQNQFVPTFASILSFWIYIRTNTILLMHPEWSNHMQTLIIKPDIRLDWEKEKERTQHLTDKGINRDTSREMALDFSCRYQDLPRGSFQQPWTIPRLFLCCP